MYPDVLIAYTENRERFASKVFNHYISQLPAMHREQILKYQFWEDAQACLYGKLLLRAGLVDLGIAGLDLKDIKYTSNKRPYFDSPEIDFNISHSGQLVVCAIAVNVRLGIDIEQVKPIEVADFKDQFSDEEMAVIRADGDNLRNFYALWTKKEALLKGNGKGLSIPLKQVVVKDNITSVESQAWFLTEIRIFDGYCCHLSTKTAVSNPILIKKYTF
jgi:4'-phosphopantetheinyl transferase